MSDVDARHHALLQTLVDHDVRFVLVGGVALQLHGYSRRDPGRRRDGRGGSGQPHACRRSASSAPCARVSRGCSRDRLQHASWPAGGHEQHRRHRRLRRLEARRRRHQDGRRSDRGGRGAIRPVGIKGGSRWPKDLDVLPLVRAELLAAGTLDLGDVRGEVAELEHESPPDPATKTFLGDRPAGRRTRGLWDRGGNLLAEYRRRWKLDDDDAIRRPTGDTPQAQDYAALERQLDRLRRLIDRASENA